MKLGRVIARDKGHLVREFDLKQLRPHEMAAILKGLKSYFCTFLQICFGELGRDIGGCKGQLGL